MFHQSERMTAQRFDRRRQTDVHAVIRCIVAIAATGIGAVVGTALIGMWSAATATTAVATIGTISTVAIRAVARAWRAGRK
jgi:hypothetical protein